MMLDSTHLAWFVAGGLSGFVVGVAVAVVGLILWGLREERKKARRLATVESRSMVN